MGLEQGGTATHTPKAHSHAHPTQFLELDNSASWLDRLDTGFDFADIFNAGGQEEAPTDGAWE